MKLPHECNSIGEVRQEIDYIDKNIISLIGQRFSYIREIVKYKNDIDAVYAKERYLNVIRIRRHYAADNKLDPDLIEDLYRIMLDYSINEQLELFKKKQK